MLRHMTKVERFATIWLWCGIFVLFKMILHRFDESKPRIGEDLSLWTVWVSDCVSTDFRCFKEFTFIQKPLTIYRNCQREWTQKLVRLSQKQGQAVGDNMKLCYWTMTAFSCPLFRCPPIPVPQFRCRGPWTVKSQETAVRSQQEHTPFIIHLVVGLKFWVLGLLDETDIQSTQRMSLNQQSACAFAFCFRRSEWLWAFQEVLLVGEIAGTPTEALGRSAFPDTSVSFMVVWSEWCCVTVVTPSNLRHNWKIPVISHRFVFN